MTMVAYVQAALPPCPIPGCRSITGREGEPCPDCVKQFGEYLTRNPDGGRRMTSEEVIEHKAATLDAYRVMLAPAAPDPEPERKQNQRCWICEERHTCTRVPHPSGWAWECDSCRQVA